MEGLPVDPAEQELRKNQDFIDSLKMIGEGGPIYELPEEDDSVIKKRNESHGFDEKDLPRDYQ